MRRNKRAGLQALAVIPAPNEGQEDSNSLAMAQQSPDIPPHVWALLQEAGLAAAEALLDLIQSPRFRTYRPAEQRGLIELALTRAYGLPVRRSISVELSSTDADAVAASLMGLHDALPERQAKSPAKGQVNASPYDGDPD